jgi:NADH-quinone oxidoreductase subunit C
VADPTTSEESAADPVADEPVELYGCPVTHSRGQTVIHPTRETYLATAKAVTDDGYIMCVDLTAVDYLAGPARDLPAGIVPERFEVAAMFLDLQASRRIRLRVQVPESDPTLPTLFDVHPGTEAMEREVFDMFGITFDDHPDMTRILMPEDWVGHPLRKDYEVGQIPVQFKGAHS